MLVDGFADLSTDRNSKETVTVHTDLVVGADGAHSATRRMLQKSVRLVIIIQYSCDSCL